MENNTFLSMVNIFEILEKTSSRLEIIDILSDYFSEIILKNKEELIPSIYLCLNTIAPSYENKELGISEVSIIKAISQFSGESIENIKNLKKNLGDLGNVIVQYIKNTNPILKINDIYKNILIISEISGKGSSQKKLNIIIYLYEKCTKNESLYLTRILSGKLRIGIAEQSILHAIAIACTKTPLNNNNNKYTLEDLKTNIEILKKVYSYYPNFEIILKTLFHNNFDDLLEKCGITIGIPLKPMLAVSAKNISEIKTGFDVSCEYKYDGERLQIHIENNKVKIFSRNQEDNTDKYPDIVDYILQSINDNVISSIIEGEVVAWDIENKNILPFQVLSKRKRKNVSINSIEIPVCIFLFDILYFNTSSLIELPLFERKSYLFNNFKKIQDKVFFVEQKTFSVNSEKIFTKNILEFLEDSINGNYEGIMIKDNNSTYEISKRSNKWTKLKKDYINFIGDTLDLIVIGGYFGKGKRVGVYGGFLLSTYNNNNNTYETICKIGTGFSDEDLNKFTKKLNKISIKNPRNNYIYEKSPDVWFEPIYIWEVKCADFSKSPIYTCGKENEEKGISLRFPRFVRERLDKNVKTSTFSEDILKLYNNN